VIVVPHLEVDYQVSEILFWVLPLDLTVSGLVIYEHKRTLGSPCWKHMKNVASHFFPKKDGDEK
jgi:hypothetical protein